LRPDGTCKMSCFRFLAEPAKRLTIVAGTPPDF
jgi:hypothetical protein